MQVYLFAIFIIALRAGGNFQKQLKFINERMDKSYIKVESIINNAKHDLSKIFKNSEYKGLENR